MEKEHQLQPVEDFSKKVSETETYDGTEEACSKYAEIVTEKPKASGAREEPSMSTEDKDTP
jgi:hypothetical protein